MGVGTKIELSGPGYDIRFEATEEGVPIRNAAGRMLAGNLDAVKQFDRVVEQARGALVAATVVYQRQAEAE